ncbi:MAG: hypothetical protein SGJ20_17370 [Planctomycetota bacterium]|nr:hypothetical protein [Planctomycetota bacterium]
MTCTRDYGVHFAGVDLKVSGLAFQQQDLGVSRCATVALWCALHKVGERETIATLTPADITNLASRHRLPFGRSMPSEGLAVDQLCLAIESVGVSPYLAMVPSVERGRSLIYSATLSHMPCILIMQKVGAERDWHAVTVAGIKLASVHAPCYVGGSKVAGDDLSGDMKALYVHDDRVGPYCRVDINGTDPNALHLSINTQGHVKGAIPEDWVIRNVLIPTHSKIRVSFNDLRTICVDWLIAEIQSVIANEQCKSPGDLDAVQFKYWIERGHEYSRRVLTEQLLTKEKGISLCKTYVMPRYVGVIRFISSAFGQIDVLMDTTSPRPNYNWIGVVARHTDDESGRLRHIVGEYLAECCQCQDQYFS